MFLKIRGKGGLLSQGKVSLSIYENILSKNVLSSYIIPAFIITTFIIYFLWYKKQNKNKTKIIAPKRTPEDSELDPQKSLEELFDNIRACDFDRFPPYFKINGEKVYIELSRETDVKDKDNKYDI